MTTKHKLPDGTTISPACRRMTSADQPPLVT